MPVLRIMNKQDKKYLLRLARRTLQKYFQDKEVLQIEEDNLPQTLKEKRGTFVTLWKNQKLRGCIGDLANKKPIYQSVIDNSMASALIDPRFMALKKDELNDIKIEISILSELKKIPNFASPNSFLKYLNKHQSGILIKKGAYQATFLPQVWEELTSAETFISHLCEKAGLDKNEWGKMNLEVYGYTAEVFKEE
jgi:AmmeMemoRadiSam system protein A